MVILRNLFFRSFKVVKTNSASFSGENFFHNQFLALRYLVQRKYLCKKQLHSLLQEEEACYGHFGILVN